MSESRGGRKRKAPPNTEWRGEVLWGRKQINGRLKRWTLRTGDVEVARERVDADIARLSAAVYYGDQRPTYKDTFVAWAETHIVDQVGPLTAKRYASSLRQLEPFILDLFVDEIDKAKVKEIVDKRRAAGVSIATIRRDLTALSSVLEFAEVDENAALARLKKLKERRDPIVLPDPAHVARVIARAPGRIPAIAEAARRTGLRLEELVGAERSKLDHSHRQLTVRAKRNKTLTVDLAVNGAYELLRAIPAHIGSKWLFWHGKGEPYRNLSSRFAALVRREFIAAYDAAHGTTAKTRPPLDVLLEAQKGKDWKDIGFRTFTFHHLRHLFAVEWLKAGRSIYDLQQRLGHESIKTTEVYTRFLTPEEKRAVMFGPPANDVDVRQGA